MKSAWTPTQEKPAAAGETTVNLLIVKSLRWKLSQFFIAIGYLKPGEEKAMNWSIVPGSTGTCAVTLREWTGNDGKKHTGNDVARFYDPERSPVPPTPPASPAAPATQYAPPPSPTYQSAPAAAGNQTGQYQIPLPKTPANPCLSDSYQRVLEHFSGARVLGVTATPDRGDMKNLGQYFEHLAYEYTLPKAIREGYLCPIKAVTIPLKLDLTGVGIQAGDFKNSDIDTALDPNAI